METELQETALLKFLHKKSTAYYGKVEELHPAVADWLAYIPHTFPHYTRHTIQHSIEIIKQISDLLFEDKDPDKLVINSFSSTEAYILIAAAYLHDSGMVCSDKEKSEILMSDGWREWTNGEGGGARRWQEIQAFINGDKPVDNDLRHFLADIQIRFLLAEYVRKTHHWRSAQVINLHQGKLARFAFDDPLLLKAITNVCISHGMRRHELEDGERFPDRSSIRGDYVNQALLAVLLRIGDLLDMSHDRACPLLLNAASPLPADSLAHWTQYHCLTHRLTAPDKIEITASCQNHEEHRYLRDWCQWLVDEVDNAAVLASHWKRHHEWRAPIANMIGDHPTIKIQAAPEATYIPGDWKLELDNDAIFERLIYDVYDNPVIFLRELMQNALDADHSGAGDLPEYPTQFPEEVRQQYLIKVTLENRQVKSDLSGELETRQVLIIEDPGLGMDEDIIKKFFLQIGRSFYITDEFRKKYQFHPTSRFGVGFLSVFAVSDFVEIETFKPESGDGPLRLTLTGPRNYLLVEKGVRATSGTSIAVSLRQPFSSGKMTKLLTEWCRRVEFPIVVNESGNETTIVAENAEDFTYEMPLVTDAKAKFVVRAFPLNRPGIEGELYVFAKIDDHGESWVDYKWAIYQYPLLHPNAQPPEFLSRIICINGIILDPKRDDFRFFISYSSTEDALQGFRLDLRRSLTKLNLARDDFIELINVVTPEINSRWQEILTQHLSETPLAHGDQSWIYKQQMVEIFSIPSFWANQPETIKVIKKGKDQFTSLEELREHQIITFIFRPTIDQNNAEIAEYDNDAPTILKVDINKYSDIFLRNIFEKRKAENARWIDKGYFAIDFIKSEDIDCFDMEYVSNYIIELPDEKTFIYPISFVRRYSDTLLFNKRHKLVEYLVVLRKACNKSQYNLNYSYFKNLLKLIHRQQYIFNNDFHEIKNYLEVLKGIPGLPEELRPPEITFSQEMFHLTQSID